MFPATILSLLSNACPSPIPGPATRADQDWVPHPGVRECQLHKGIPRKAADGCLSGSVSVYGQRWYQLEVPWSSHLSPNYLLQPLQTFPEPEPMLWLYRPLGFLLLLHEAPLKKQGYCSQVLKGTLHAPGHTARSQVVRHRVDLGLSLLGSTVGCLGFHRFTLYWWI